MIGELSYNLVLAAALPIAAGFAVGQEDDNEYAKGLLPPFEEYKVDDKSEEYFRNRNRFRNRAGIPLSYSSVEKGLVSPVKNQGNCGSCVAFASTASAEACSGAPMYAYLHWINSTRQEGLWLQNQYPYVAKYQYQCPNLPIYKQGAKISKMYYTYKTNEATLMQFVYKHGAAVTTLKATGTLDMHYVPGTIYDGCSNTVQTDHAVTVVGYGTENGTPYWLVKNSWGTSWGDKGFFRIKRGVDMCGIGRALAVVDCIKDDDINDGTTDPTMPTYGPCFDQLDECRDLVDDCEYDLEVQNSCPQTCNIC